MLIVPSTLETEEEIKNIDIFYKILKFFEGDLVKTIKWFTIENPLLGNVRPLTMMEIGRSDKLELFIDNQLNGINP